MHTSVKHGHVYTPILVRDASLVLESSLIAGQDNGVRAWLLDPVLHRHALVTHRNSDLATST
jgi:hypothetical protein